MGTDRIAPKVVIELKLIYSPKQGQVELGPLTKVTGGIRLPRLAQKRSVLPSRENAAISDVIQRAYGVWTVLILYWLDFEKVR